MSDKKRRILNKAASVAKEDSEMMYEKSIERLQDARQSADLLTGEVDEIIFEDFKDGDIVDSWFTNRCQGMSGGHMFSVYDFYLLVLFFNNHDGYDTEMIKSKAMDISTERLMDIDLMLNHLPVDESTVERSLDFNRGWMSENIESPTEVTLLKYYRIVVFLEFISIAYAKKGYLDDADKQALEQGGCLPDEVVA